MIWLRILLCASLTAFWAPSARAWNGRGHMIIAAVAWQHMDPVTQRRAGELVKFNPLYARWVKGVPVAQRNEIAFVVGATWPDLIQKWQELCPRGVAPNTGTRSTYTYCSDTYQPTYNGAGRNIGYTDRLEHRYWHFIDIPFSPDGTPLVQPEVPNARTEIAVFEATLGSDTASEALKSYDLVWLEHLVGDVHQPLHAVNRFTATFPEGDEGGTLVCTGTRMSTRNGKKVCKTNLHTYWDDLLGQQVDPASDAANADAAITVAKTLDQAAPQEVRDDNIDQWITESFALAKSTAYAPPMGMGAGPYDIYSSKTYTENAVAVARMQAELAGERLAKLLNDHLR